MTFKVSKTRDIITPESAEYGDFDHDRPEHGRIFEDKQYSFEDLVSEMIDDFGGLFEDSISSEHGTGFISVYYPEFTSWDYTDGSEFRDCYHIEGDPQDISRLINALLKAKSA